MSMYTTQKMLRILNTLNFLCSWCYTCTHSIYALHKKLRIANILNFLCVVYVLKIFRTVWLTCQRQWRRWCRYWQRLRWRTWRWLWGTWRPQTPTPPAWSPWRWTGCRNRPWGGRPRPGSAGRDWRYGDCCVLQCLGQLSLTNYRAQREWRRSCRLYITLSGGRERTRSGRGTCTSRDRHSCWCRCCLTEHYFQRQKCFHRTGLMTRNSSWRTNR